MLFIEKRRKWRISNAPKESSSSLENKIPREDLNEKDVANEERTSSVVGTENETNDAKNKESEKNEDEPDVTMADASKDEAEPNVDGDENGLSEKETANIIDEIFATVRERIRSSLPHRPRRTRYDPPVPLRDNKGALPGRRNTSTNPTSPSPRRPRGARPDRPPPPKTNRSRRPLPPVRYDRIKM